MVQYGDWETDRREEKSESSMALAGGAVIDIFVKKMIGEFSIQFINNFGSSDTAVGHLLFTGTGKYAHFIRETTFLSAGLGIYYESGPATTEFNGGGGLQLALGTGFLVSTDWYLTLDLTIRYGSYGKGDQNTKEFLFLDISESTKLNLGLTIAAVYRVGRL